MKKLLLILLIVICIPLSLIMILLVLGLVTEIFFGGGSMFGLTVIDNVMAVINGLGGAGFATLVGLTVLLSLLIIKWRRKY